MIPLRIRQRSAGSAAIVCLVAVCAGCISSEESGGGARAKSPVQILGSVDTAQQQPAAGMQAAVRNNGQKPARTAPRFRSKQDTVRASVVTKQKNPARSALKIERPEHARYTVQIGAFSRVSNAVRAQKKAKERFHEQPVFNKYVRKAGVYRVSIGRYEEPQEAFAFCAAMKKKYPEEYSKCWINFIP